MARLIYKEAKHRTTLHITRLLHNTNTLTVDVNAISTTVTVSVYR